ncbi:hypothetical protein AB4Y44_27945 [Paraburkholderia sp. BR10937]|uniref:hypothetical protein n=1 Tax=Paraburkholderia sp. BR10937 TaxID=3236994 RepID=UPI0034D24999
MAEHKAITDRHGRTIDLYFDEDNLWCTAKDGATVIGRFEFDEIEEEHTRAALLLLRECFLDNTPGYTHCGIGTAIIEFVAEYGYTVLMREHDGNERGDGSHLIGDGPGFASALERRNLIARY